MINGFVEHIGSIFNRYVPTIIRKQDGRYSYGEKDLMPQQIIEMIASNPTAMRCVLKRAEYIAANGFVDEALNDFVVTKGKTARHLLNETAIQTSMFECVSWHIARYGNKEVASTDIHPYEFIRRGTSGVLWYNSTLGSNEQKNDWIKYPAFSLTPQMGLGYKGEVLYEWHRSPMAMNFPVPSWYSGEMDIRTGIELAMMDTEMAENGFMVSAILKVIGEIDDTVKDANGETARDKFKKNIQQFTGKGRGANGVSKRYSLLVLYAASKEEMPELQSIDVKDLVTGSIEKRESIDKTICRIFDVNPVLLHHDVQSILGQDAALRNAKGIMAESVIHYQNLIKECFEKVYPKIGGREVKWDLTTLDPSKVVLIKSENQVILDTLNSLSPLLSAEIVKRLGDKELFKLVGLPENTQGINANQ